MCLICIDFQRGALTTTEAYRNLQEMAEGMTDEHYDEVVSTLINAITDEQVDAQDEENLGELIDRLEINNQLSFEWDDITDIELELDEPLEIPWGNDYYSAED